MMKLRRPNHQVNGTRYIQIDLHQCRACWKCLESCPAGVFGKNSMPFHKHIRIDQPEKCQGCQKCVKVCPRQAITANQTHNSQNMEVVK